MATVSPSQSTSRPPKRHFDVCSRPANPAKRIKSPRNSPPKFSAASDTPRPATEAVVDEDAEDVESDASSEVSSSSEEPSDDSDDSDDNDDSEDELATSADNEDEVVNLRANRGKKPVMDFEAADMGDDIRSFLKDFLPKLKAANEELEAQKAAGTFKPAEIVDDGQRGGEDDGRYIELNLGLGVLEEKDAGVSDSSESEDDEMGNADESRIHKDDVLRKLMGHERVSKPAGIEVVDEPKGG